MNIFKKHPALKRAAAVMLAVPVMLMHTLVSPSEAYKTFIGFVINKSPDKKDAFNTEKMLNDLHYAEFIGQTDSFAEAASGIWMAWLGQDYVARLKGLKGPGVQAETTKSMKAAISRGDMPQPFRHGGEEFPSQPWGMVGFVTTDDAKLTGAAGKEGTKIIGGQVVGDQNIWAHSGMLNMMLINNGDRDNDHRLFYSIDNLQIDTQTLRNTYPMQTLGINTTWEVDTGWRYAMSANSAIRRPLNAGEIEGTKKILKMVDEKAKSGVWTQPFVIGGGRKTSMAPVRPAKENKRFALVSGREQGKS
jgi:hypothetical protein